MSSRTHGFIDYGTVLILLFSPNLIEMETTATLVTLTLAIVHLILTALTDFELGIFKIVPFRIHGMIEIVVALGLIGLAICFRFLGDNQAFYFYLIFSLVLFTVWIATDYKRAATPRHDP